jgi:hypothetical protein
MTRIEVEYEERRPTRGFTTRREDHHEDSRRGLGEKTSTRIRNELAETRRPQARSIRSVRGREPERGIVTG